MDFEEKQPSDYSDDNSIYGGSAQQTPNAQPNQPSMPMGAPKRRRGRGCLTAALVLAVILISALCAHRLANTWDFSLDHGEHGLRLSMSRRGTATEAEEQEPFLPVREQPQKQEEIRQPDGEPQQIAESHPVLEQKKSAPGAENIVSGSKGALSLQDIYSKAIPSVVSITTNSATGTGIIMSTDGYIITNHHVISGSSSVSILTHDDREMAAQIIGSDETSDLAVLKVQAEDLEPAEFGDSESLRVGDSVVAIGDPLGTALRGTMTDGIISAINRDLLVRDRKMTLIQTNAAMNNGNSGGPLINCYGQVIGINTVKMSSYYSGSSVEGIGFAIPISTAKPIIDELIEKGYVSGRPALGFRGESLPLAVRSYYRLPSGVYITEVAPNSDAWAKGLSESDIVTAIGETPVSAYEQLVTAISGMSAGDTVELTVYRGGNYYSVDIVLVDQATQQ